MEANEDRNETDEVESHFEEESVLSESGFEELACKYDVCVIFQTKRKVRPVCLSLHSRRVKDYRLYLHVLRVFVRSIIIMRCVLARPAV